ncbi:MAG: dihydrofolate reductase [Parcubacteria group bacterium]
MPNQPRISIIAVIGARTRALGKDNKLLWDIPEDLRRFRRITKGHVVIMGRKTHESIGRPLPHRLNIVITRNPDYKTEGCTVVTSLELAIEEAKKHEKEEIFIIGGAQIYEQAMPYTDRLYLTLVDDATQGDAYFPEYAEFKTIIKEEFGSSAGFQYSFLTLEK